MSKPTDLPVWATDANIADPGKPWDGAPTKTEPMGSEQASGWKPGDKPPAQYLNWWQNLVYTWFVWLDGVFGSDGSLEVSQVFETEEFDHGHHASAWKADDTGGGASGTNYNGFYWSFSSGSTLYSPLDYLRPGDVITDIGWSYDRNSAGTVTTYLVRRVYPGGLGGDTTVQSDADSASGAAPVEVVRSYNHTIETGYAYALRVDCNNAAHEFISARVFVTRPRP